MGIVAALTVPSVVRRQIEASNRTKIKKIMGVYDGFIQKAVIENDIKSEQAFRDWADSANAENHDCENSSGYFKVTKYVGDSDGVNNKCEFSNPDGVVLNITDPLNPVVAPSEKDYLKYKADNNYAKAYKFVVSFDKKTGAFRVNDITYEMAQLQEENTEENKEKMEELEKLYGFLNPKSEKTTKNPESNIGKVNFTPLYTEFASGCDDVDTCSAEYYLNYTTSDVNYISSGGEISLYCRGTTVEEARSRKDCNAYGGLNYTVPTDTGSETYSCSASRCEISEYTKNIGTSNLTMFCGEIKNNVSSCELQGEGTFNDPTLGDVSIKFNGGDA